MSILTRLLPSLFEYQLLLKMYHWQTASYVRHTASDELYKQLLEFIDHLVEYDQGSYPRMRIQAQSITIHNMSDEDGIPFLNSLRRLLESIRIRDRGISARRDDMIGYVDQALYLFQLE
jgi:DNA-binding ferritin-like protein